MRKTKDRNKLRMKIKMKKIKKNKSNLRMKKRMDKMKMIKKIRMKIKSLKWSTKMTVKTIRRLTDCKTI